MHTMEYRYVRRNRTYGIMVLGENNGGILVWEVYYKITGCPWTYAFGLPAKNRSPFEMFDIAESNFDIYGSMIFHDDEED